MSTLYLCQIPEFSSDYKNVANFSSKSDQLNWMNSKVIMTAATNAKLDNFTTSVVLSQSMSVNLRKCDYLFCNSTDDSKRLFFFIDNMEQLSPSTVQLSLSLDMWQTYHLDITFFPSYVERMHVNRWEDDNYPTKEVVPEPINVGEMVVTRATPRVRKDQGNYIYTTSSPIGLITKDTDGTGGGGDEPTPPTGDCGNPELGIPTPNGFLFIKGYEGLAQYAYDIGDGVMTIGYGCTDAYDGDNYMTLKANEPVSDELASSVMAESLVANYGVPLKNSLASDGIRVSPNEFDAILSFVYNAGLGSWNNSAIRTALLNGDKDGAYTAWLTQNIMSGTQFEDG